MGHRESNKDFGAKSEKIRLTDKRIRKYRIVPGIAADVNGDIEHASPQYDLFDEIIIIEGREVLIKTLLRENPQIVYLDDLKSFLNKYGYDIEPPLV